ncbi:MAG: hypothetical protein NT154_40545 [Verrucomicrobia bacterium]|nr:hypothetical protein [Verrucomicrobiota bacterium]
MVVEGGLVALLLALRNVAALPVIAYSVLIGAAVLFQPPIAWTAGRFRVVVPEVVVVRHAVSINVGHGDKVIVARIRPLARLAASRCPMAPPGGPDTAARPERTR